MKTQSCNTLPRLLRQKQLGTYYGGASDPTIYRYKKSGLIPPANVILGGVEFWSEDYLVEDIERRRLDRQKAA